MWKGNKASNVFTSQFIREGLLKKVQKKNINPPSQMHESILKNRTYNRATQNKHHIQLHNICSHELKMQSLFLGTRLAHIPLRKLRNSCKPKWIHNLTLFTWTQTNAICLHNWKAKQDDICVLLCPFPRHIQISLAAKPTQALDQISTSDMKAPWIKQTHIKAPGRNHV